MTTYDQAAVTYDDPATLYDGISLGDDATLIVNGEDVTGYLAAGSLSVHVGTQGNSLGTLDAKLNDPASVPALDAQVDMYAGTVRLFRGDSKAVNTDEYRGGHLFVTLSAQDTGPDGSNPTAAPFGLSDAPNGSTTFGYESLRALSRTTEGGSPKTTYQASYRGAGLWAGMNVEITSTNHGLSADEFTVVEATLQYPARNAPLYLLTLGDPIVKLAQIIADGELIPDGAITSTKISDGAISTPKLAANAVTAAKIEAGTITATEIASGAITSAKFATAAQAPGVLNSTGYVEIDSTGVAITNGALSVTNPGGTVIIDGSSDMFRIVATGTLSHTQAAGSDGSTTVTLSALGAQTVPLAFVAYVAESNSLTGVWWDLGHLVNWSTTFVAPTSGGSPVQQARTANWVAWVSAGLTSANAYPIVRLSLSNSTTTSKTAYARYYLLAQAAF